MNIKDYATGLITNTPGTSGLTFTVGDATPYPDVPFLATVAPDGEMPTLSNAEKVLVTTIDGSDFTVERAKGDTTAKNVDAGWRLSNALFIENFQDLVSQAQETVTAASIPIYNGTTGRLLSGTNIQSDTEDIFNLSGVAEFSIMAGPTGVFDVITEYYSDSGVQISGVLVKDGLVDNRDLIADGLKLDGIEIGAEVNTVNPADIADFETTTELNARDTANRNRANHTGTQALATLSDLADLHPVGTIYMNEANSANPSTYLPGQSGSTWTAIEGRVIAGHGANGIVAGETGGASVIDLSHSHTVNSHNHSIGSHSHSLSENSAWAQILVSNANSTAVRGRFTSSPSWTQTRNTAATASNVSSGQSNATPLMGNTDSTNLGNTGNASPGTNSQLSSSQSIWNPYYGAYCWRRTA